MMNTRSRARLQAETSARDALNKERMGIEFIENFSITRFGRLKEREIRSTKWACPTILNQLGMTDDFNLLCNRVGLLADTLQTYL